MSKVPDAWDEAWVNEADKLDTPLLEAAAKVPSKKQTKAQKRAQQAEFNRQLWAEAEGPKETNFFLESRNVQVPLRSEFKPPPVLLSRKGPPIVQQKPKADPAGGLQNLDLNKKEESSEDEDEVTKQRLEREQRQQQSKKDREEKQKKYEERRQELFGITGVNGRPTSRSGQSSPTSATPPGSRSQTPRGRGRGGRGSRGNGQGRGGSQQHQHRQSQQELFEAVYSPKPDSVYIERRKERELNEQKKNSLEKPIRQSRGPDGSGRGGFGFATRGGKTQAPAIQQAGS